MRTLLTRLAARATDRLPASVEQQMLRARSLVSGDAPTIGLPDVSRVLVIAPHPDDETLACGGTAAALAAAGATVRTVVLTDGEAAKVDLPAEERGRRRRAEVHAACAALGIDAPVLVGLPDGALDDHTDAAAAEIAGHLDGFAPQLVLLPWFGDGHRDHRAANVALARAARQVAVAPEVWGGETWTPCPATRLVDVTATLPALQAAVAEHATAARSFDLEAMLAIKRYRSIHGLRGRGWAEAFLAAPLPAYAELVTADLQRTPS